MRDHRPSARDAGGSLVGLLLALRVRLRFPVRPSHHGCRPNVLLDIEEHVLSFSRITLGGVALLPLAFILSTHGRDGPEQGARAERQILEHEIAAMEAVVREAPNDSLIPFSDALVRIDDVTLEHLLDAGLPYQTVVGGRFRIRIDDAVVRCENGVAQVRLSGRASLIDRPDTYAEALVHGALRQFAVDSATSTLRTRVEVLTFTVPKFQWQGKDSEIGKGLVRDLARLRVDVFHDAFQFDLPIHLEDLVVPAVRTRHVRIAALRVPFDVEVEHVNALRGMLWLSLRFGTGRRDTLTAATQGPG